LIVKEEDVIAAKGLKSPAGARVICYYRNGKFSHADEETQLLNPLSESLDLYTLRA
jgi:trk system potassium uptake protein TrkA